MTTTPWLKAIVFALISPLITFFVVEAHGSP